MLDVFGGHTGIKGTRTGYFHIENILGRYWLITPEGNAFLSLGINHIDQSALQYNDNMYIWKDKYKGCRKEWIEKGVVADLKGWNFNTIGWTQEMVTKDFAHSAQWDLDDFVHANMPFCYLLPFAEIQRYKKNPYYPDVEKEEFRDWCDYIARSICLDMKDNPNLIGYFYSDVPGWVFNSYTLSWAESCGIDINCDLGKLYNLASNYYTVIHDSIRRYDKNHLLLGDRYCGKLYLPECIYHAAKDTIDIFSFEFYKQWNEIEQFMTNINQITSRPVMICDGAYGFPSKFFDPQKDTYYHGKHFGKAKGEGSDVHIGFCEAENEAVAAEMYIRNLGEAFSKPYFLGWHWCVYLENHVRKRGIKDHFDNEYFEFTIAIKDFNRKIYNIYLNV